MKKWTYANSNEIIRNALKLRKRLKEAEETYKDAVKFISKLNENKDKKKEFLYWFGDILERLSNKNFRLNQLWDLLEDDSFPCNRIRTLTKNEIKKKRKIAKKYGLRIYPKTIVVKLYENFDEDDAKKIHEFFNHILTFHDNFFIPGLFKKLGIAVYSRHGMESIHEELHEAFMIYRGIEEAKESVLDEVFGHGQWDRET